MRRLLAVTFLVFIGCQPVANAAPEVRIQEVDYIGSGCRAGSAEVALDEDATELSISFDRFTASVGPHIPVGEHLKDCFVSVTLHVGNRSRHVAVHGAAFRGYLYLHEGVTARMESVVIASCGQQRTLTAVWEGPHRDDFSVSDVLDEPVFSENPGNLVSLGFYIWAELDNENNRQGSGLLTAHSSDQRMAVVYGLRWEPEISPAAA